MKNFIFKINRALVAEKKLFLILVACLMIAFVSCEQITEVTNPSITDDDSTTIEQPSPIKGKWECLMNGVKITFDFGNNEVEYVFYLESLNATATYNGTYTIEENDITINFTSLTTKNSSGIHFTIPERMPKDAILVDDSTIQYAEYTFKRKK